jgi:hypothetical protein
VSSSDAWAVGTAGVHTLALHWNGTSWSRVASPSPGGGNASTLGAVSARSSSDAWAVGEFQFTSTEDQTKTLALRWNGTSWSRVASPSPGGLSGSALGGVSTLSPSDAWAVGSYTGSNGASVTLLLHWNGAQWSRA